MSMKSITISKLKQDQIPGFLSFIDRTLGNEADFRKLWHWREQGIPASGGEQAVVAIESSEVVGCVGIVPLIVSINGRHSEAIWQQDSLVSPAMRGQGVGKKIVLEGEKGRQLIMAKGTSNAMYGLRKALGYADVPFSDYLVAVHRAQPGMTKKAVMGKVLSLWQKILPLPRLKNALPIKKISVFDSVYDDLASTLARESGVVRPLKNSGYLNWRYFQCPVKKYTVLQAGEKRPRGAIILGTSNKNPMEGWVVDMLCPSDDKSCAYSLLNEARRHFSRHHIERVLAFATLPVARRWLMRFGFVPTRRSPRFTYKLKNIDSSPDLLQKAQWNFWHGDGDLDLYT